MKILLIDDSRTMRNIQKNVLQQIGIQEVTEAVDGEDGMKQYLSSQPTLILCDWNMPNVDGITFVQRLRAAGHKTPVIMVTTEAEKAKVVEAIKAGVNGYVVKPFTPDLLKTRIDEVMSKAA
ncbi:MAG: response regulator [Candidatus Eisenbacteria bacterium]|nr:response regulator [Candidatus Eisenbacteria bacterium]MCC7142944.1 response regulator [Candidatus Eisenbacteria bacterium]